MNSKKPTDSARTRILVVDDHPMMRQGLAYLINNEADLSICAEAQNGREALNAVTREKPDLVLADITLPDKNGLELVKDILTIEPGTLVLVISMHEESLYAERVLRAGARGYVMKQKGGQKLMTAIRQVLGGRIYVSEKMSADLLENFSGRTNPSASEAHKKLSDREFEVLELIGNGKGTREMAELLHLSVKTVEVHRANIKKKLAIKKSPELVRYAVQWVESQSSR